MHWIVPYEDRQIPDVKTETRGSPMFVGGHRKIIRELCLGDLAEQVFPAAPNLSSDLPAGSSLPLFA